MKVIEQESPSPKRTTPLWRNRDYVLLWSGQTISSLGSAVSRLAFPLLILALTGSPLQAGFVGALNVLPYLVLSLPAGALIDRWDRKRVMILCDIGRGLNMASIPIALAFGHLTVLQLYVNATIEGILFVFFNIAEVACLPRVVPEEQLAAAAGQNEASQGAATLIGPLLSGVFFLLRHLLPFLVDAISYAISVVSLLFIRTEFQEERTITHRRLHVEIAEGLLWLWRQPLVRFIALLTGGFNFVFAGIELLIIVLAQRQHASAAVIGIIFAIAGVGSILGSLLAAPVQKRFTFGQVIIGVAWLQAAFWPFFVLAPNPLLLGVVAAALFILGPLYNVVQFSYRLTLIPDALQGRVNSVFRLVAFGFQPVGLVVTGILIQQIGPIPTTLVFAVCFIALAVLATLNSHIRNARATPEAQAEV